MTGNVTSIRHSYKVERVKKVYTVYRLELSQENLILSESIRIEQFRNFSKEGGFDHNLRLKNTTSCKASELVKGQKKIVIPNVFLGDRMYGGKKHLVVFKFPINCIEGYYLTTGDLNAILSKYM